MSKETFVEYVVYKGEKASGSVVIKSEKPNSPFRVFVYTKGTKYRVGSGINVNQARFLIRNHADLFRLEKVKVEGRELVSKSLEEVISQLKAEIECSPESLLGNLIEASMDLLGFSSQKDLESDRVEKLLKTLPNIYKDSMDMNSLKSIFLSMARSIQTPEKVVEKVTETVEETEEESSTKRLLKRRKE